MGFLHMLPARAAAAAALLLLTTRIAGAADVVLWPLAGDKLQGQLQSLSADKIVLTTAGGERTLAVKEVQSLEFAAAAAGDKPAIWLELVDGSQLAAQSYQAAQGQATVELL